MKKILLSGLLLGSVFMGSYAKGQLLLEALDAPSFVPTEKCLERVKDRNYGDGDHNFIYCAVKGPDGRIWLNHNLGAEYAKEGSEYFNPEAVPDNNNDWKAFGSLFQPGRGADGHELVTYHTTDEQGNDNGYWNVKRIHPIVDRTERKEYQNAGKNFVVTESGLWGYADFQLPELWAGEGVNNPCPQGYNIPTPNDMKKLFDHIPTRQEGGLRQTTIYGFGNLNIVMAPTGAYTGIHTSSRILEDNTKGTSSLWLRAMPIFSEDDVIIENSDKVSLLKVTMDKDWVEYQTRSSFYGVVWPYVLDRGLVLPSMGGWVDLYLGPNSSLAIRIDNLAIRCIKNQ